MNFSGAIFSAIDLSPVTDQLAAGGESIVAAALAAFSAALAFGGMMFGSRALLRHFKEMSGHHGSDGRRLDGGHPEWHAHVVSQYRGEIPPMAGTWRGSQEGWETDYMGRHPGANNRKS